MKKTIAVIGSAAALSFAGAGLAAAEDVATDDQAQAPETTAVDTDTEATDTTDAEGDAADTEDAPDDADTPEEVSDIAAQLCGTVSAYDFLGSAEGIAPGLSGEECEANADAAVAAAMAGDIGGALDILRGIDAETPGDDDDAADTGSASMLESLGGGAEGDDAEADVEQPAFGS